MIRSPFFYVGDKYKLMPQLCIHFPADVKRLIEPFCGGGSVFLNYKTNEYYANDLNTYMINLHKFLFSFKNRRSDFFDQFENEIKSYGFSASYLGITVSKELRDKYIKTYYAVFNKQAYLKLKKDFNEDKSAMMKLYVLLIYGFNHMLRFNKLGDFNLPVGNVDYNKNVRNALDAYFDFVDQNDVNFNNADFASFLLNFEFKEGDFVYLDPPYLISDCEYNKGWTEKQEQELLNILDILNKKNVKFALSNVFTHKGKSNEMLIEWSKKYKVLNVKSNYISYHDNTNKNTVEVLIINY